MKKFILLVSVFTLTLACSRHNVDSYTNSENTTVLNTPDDTNKMLISCLPIYFDSTRVLLSPVGYYDSETMNKLQSVLTSKSGKGQSDDYSVYSTNNSISGSFTNIYFDDVDNNTQHQLTNNPIHIFHIEFQRELWVETGKPFMLYQLHDKDNNQDKQIDGLDTRTLYISQLNGKEFKKISPESHQFNQGKYVAWCKRYYFTTTEDSNKNGQFDLKDAIHYFYIDFSVDPYTCVEYFPLLS